jgi:hypothetical protein
MERAGIETIHTLTDLPQKDMIAVPFTAVPDKTSEQGPKSQKA